MVFQYEYPENQLIINPIIKTEIVSDADTSIPGIRIECESLLGLPKISLYLQRLMISNTLMLYIILFIFLN
jgi:hypothetical protein